MSMGSEFMEDGKIDNLKKDLNKTLGEVLYNLDNEDDPTELSVLEGERNALQYCLEQIKKYFG